MCTEKIMSRYSVAPLVAVGWEGLFGALSIVLVMPILPLLRPSLPPSAQPFFDLNRGLHQMLDTPTVLWSGVAIAISISLFNFFGLSVTRHVSATARSLTDTCRTLSIWIISLGLGWERLVWPISVLQVLGFALLVYVSPGFLRPLRHADMCTPGTARSCSTTWSRRPSSCGRASGSLEANIHLNDYKLTTT